MSVKVAKGIKLSLDEKSHIYKDNEGNEYFSVSEIISMLSNKFDPMGKIAAGVAKREQVTVQEIKSRWGKIAQESIKKGKGIHSVLEKYIENGTYEKPYKKLIENFEDLNLSGKLYSEQRLFNYDEKIAGTTDLIEFKSSRCNVFDFKTNNEIKLFSPYNKRLKYPLNHLEECEYNKYAIQLSFYAWMLEQTGNTIGRLAILWIDKKYNIIPFPVPYMKHTVEVIINYMSKKRWSSD